MKRFSLKRFGALSSALALMVTLNGCARNFSTKGLPVESNTTTTDDTLVEDTLIEDTLVEDTLVNGGKIEVEQKTYLAKDLYVYKAKQAIKYIIDEGYPTPWETEAYNTTEDYYILHKTVTIPSETPGLEVDCYEYINAEVVDEEHGMIYYQNSINYEPAILSCIEGSAVNTKDFGFFVTINELLNELNMADLIQDSYTLEELKLLQNLLSNNSSLMLNR